MLQAPFVGRATGAGGRPAEGVPVEAGIGDGEGRDVAVDGRDDDIDAAGDRHAIIGNHLLKGDARRAAENIECDGSTGVILGAHGKRVR
ncbi:MAG: hypothetical protein M9947_07260 [Thermomicrobiales bacterium]|nr:hypothetical protein [Thermomicrobiales bacterium]